MYVETKPTEFSTTFLSLGFLTTGRNRHCMVMLGSSIITVLSSGSYLSAIIVAVFVLSGLRITRTPPKKLRLPAMTFTQLCILSSANASVKKYLLNGNAATKRWHLRSNPGAFPYRTIEFPDQSSSSTSPGFLSLLRLMLCWSAYSLRRALN